MQRTSTSNANDNDREGLGSRRDSTREHFAAPGRDAGSPNEILLAGQSFVLELLAKGAELETVLAELVRTIERCKPGMLCSVLLFDSMTKTLRHGAAPSLPAAYNRAIEGMSIGPAVGSCGTAAYTRNRVIVEDIASDPLWVNFRAIALKHNLIACWSQPVLSSTGELLGTFAMYYDSPRGPTEEEIELIERTAYLAGIAIERTRSDDAIRENEERFRQLAETVRLIPWEANPETLQFTYVGPQAVEIMGYSIEAWYQEEFWVKHLHPGDREWAVDFCLKHCKTDNQHEFEYRMVADDGRTVWLHDVVRVIRRDNQIVLRGFMIDVSDRKRTEETLKQNDRLASLGTLAAGVAHEINNPLSAILLASQRALATKDSPNKEARLKELLELIQADAERCGRIVTGVLKFSRQSVHDRAYVNINEVLTSAVDLIRSYAQERKAEVSVELSSEVTPISVNLVEMEQVFVNLIRNAIEAKSEGACVAIQTRRACDSILVSVRDNGRGMTTEQKAQVFDPFFTTRQCEGGTGLGLSIVHGIIAMHGGTIEIVSEPDQGTTVHLRLPA